jgi:predicted branched-subunit amino acid permease
VGLLVGVLAKRIVSVAVVLAALFIALVALGYTSPQQVTQILQQIGYSAKETAMNLKNAVPYSSLAFLIGLAIGLWKG